MFVKVEIPPSASPPSTDDQYNVVLEVDGIESVKKTANIIIKDPGQVIFEFYKIFT